MYLLIYREMEANRSDLLPKQLTTEVLIQFDSDCVVDSTLNVKNACPFLLACCTILLFAECALGKILSCNPPSAV